MNKTALITGAGIRVGREIAFSLARSGWDIALHYRRSEKEAMLLAGEIEAMGRKAYPVHADLQDSNAVSDMIPSLARHGVMIDCLINNASLFEKNSLAQLSEENWQAHMKVNCFAPLQLTRDFAAHYKGDAGNVINITDGLIGWSISPAFFSYSMSKLALANATELLVTTLAPHIRINAIAPGPVLENVQDKPGTFEKLKEIIPLNRTSSPQEICDAIHYILSAPALTGQTILLSGGMQAKLS